MTIIGPGSADVIFADTIHSLNNRSIEMLTVMAATLACIFVANSFAPRLGLIDNPDGKRKLHSRPIPTTGGLAILGGMWIAALLGANLGELHLSVLSLLAIVATFHALDDQASLKPTQRLILDSVIALALVVVTDEEIETIGIVAGIPISLGPAAIPVTIIIYLTLSNAYNMIDGLDGLAISQFLISILALGAYHGMSHPTQAIDPLLASFVCASLVALLANVGALGQQFRCFLGDCGSRFLAFFLAYAFVCAGSRVLLPIEAAFLVALPLFDLCCVMFERFRAGINPMNADRRHLHHLLVDSGATTFMAVGVMAMVSCCFVVLLTVLKVWQVDHSIMAVVLLASCFAYGRFRNRLARTVGGLRSRLHHAPQI